MIEEAGFEKEVAVFLIYQLPNLERKWKSKEREYFGVVRQDNIKNYMENSVRVMNLQKNGAIGKTQLIMAYRADSHCSEQTARRTIEDAIAKGILTEEIGSKTKWIRLCT